MAHWPSLYANRDAYGAKQCWLKYDHVRSDLMLQYTVIVMKLFEHEMCLSAGRFVEFDRTARQWEVRVRHTNDETPWWTRCEEMVNWIADNTVCPWSLTMRMERVSTGDFVFSFDDDRIATFFKLIFC